MSSAVKSFLETLRTGNASFEKDRELTLQTNIIKALNNDEKNSSLILLRKFFINAQFQLINEEISVNNVSIQKIESLLRAGQLKACFDCLHLPYEVNSRDELNFQSLLLPEIPEVSVLKLTEKYKQAQRQHPDLDILLEKPEDIERKLTKPAKDKLKILKNRIRNMAKNKIVHGIFAEVKVDDGDDQFTKNIAYATIYRQGCYLIKTDKKVTKSFKLVNRSCFPSNNAENTSSEFSSIVKSLPYNLQIYLRIALSDANKSKEIPDLEKKCALKPDTVTEKNIPYLILKHESSLRDYFNKDNHGNQLFKDLSASAKKTLINNLCIENNNNACISSFPYAPRDSIDYVDVSKLPVNTSIICVKKSTLLELLVDIRVDLQINGPSQSCTVF